MAGGAHVRGTMKALSRWKCDSARSLAPSANHTIHALVHRLRVHRDQRCHTIHTSPTQSFLSRPLCHHLHPLLWRTRPQSHPVDGRAQRLSKLYVSPGSPAAAGRAAGVRIPDAYFWTVGCLSNFSIICISSFSPGSVGACDAFSALICDTAVQWGSQQRVIRGQRATGVHTP